MQLSESPEIRIRRDGLGAVVNWAFLAAFAYGVWQCAVMKLTLDQHGFSIIRIEKKLDAVLDPRNHPYP